jgi:hypothetical protein
MRAQKREIQISCVHIHQKNFSKCKKYTLEVFFAFIQQILLKTFYKFYE